MEQVIIKISEKVIIWMNRKKITQQKLAAKLGITRQTLAKRLLDNSFTNNELLKLKELGIE